MLETGVKMRAISTKIQSSAGAGTSIPNGDSQAPTSPAYSALGIRGRPGFARFLKKYKSRDESRDLYFSEEGLLGSRRACPNGPPKTPEGHVGQLRWPRGATQPRRPKLDSAWFASTKTGLLSSRFPQKSSPCMRACPHAHVCNPHEAFSLGG